jgi:hypothetical protein
VAKFFTAGKHCRGDARARHLFQPVRLRPRLSIKELQ